MFHHETPSRILRRIDELEAAEQDMPTLPDLPAMSDDSLESSAPPSPMSKPADADARKSTPTLTAPFTSTPAPSTGSYRSMASMRNPPSASSSQQTIMAPIPRRPADGNDSIAAMSNMDNNSEDEIIVLSGSDEQQAPLKTVQRRVKSVGPGTPMPFGDRTNDVTPELGRHASFESSRAKSLSIEDAAETPVARQNETTKLSRAFATPSPSDADAAQRRKDHVLMSLKSTAKPRFLKGTPHPLRMQSRIESDNSSSETSSQDLTTHHRSANTSMPSAGAETKGARFNGAKLNAYLHTLNTHLTEENQSLIHALGSTNKELERVKRGAKRLEDQVREMSQAGMSINLDQTVDKTQNDDEDSSLQKQLESIVRSHESIDLLKAKITEEASMAEMQDDDEMQGRLAQLELLLRERDDEIERLKQSNKPSDDTEQSMEAGLKSEHERLLVRQDELVASLEDKDRQMLDQETVFAEKMVALETELATVMESQEEALQKARAELDEARTRQDEADRERESQMNELEDELETCAKELADKDNEIQDLRSRLADAEDSTRRLERELAALQDQVAARRTASPVLDNSSDSQQLRDLEAALADANRQLEQRVDELDSVKSQLTEERKIIASLKAQSAHATKARSPLINEIKDDSREALEEELQQARDEIRVLKHKLDGPAARAEREVQQIKVRTLEAQKNELETRVNELRKQVDVSLTPRKSPGEKSFLFKSIAGLKTPKTPGQFMNLNSPWTPGSAADTTIQPLLGQIDDLEDMVVRLQGQLADANSQIDQKLDKLNLAGTDVVSLAAKLAEKEERVSLLEIELDRIVGADGDLERIRKKLERIECPSCTSRFDANKIVKLRLDGGVISYAGSSTGRSTQAAETLRTALANVNRKLAELQAENAVLQDAAARSASRPTFAQQASLQVDFERARAEIASLERELDAERAKLKELSGHRPVPGNDDDGEIRALRAQHRKLQEERAELIKGVSSLQADLHRVRQDAVTLGLDLAAARRERTETFNIDLDRVRSELDSARRRVEVLEKQAVKTGEEATRAMHASEVKGLLIMIRYLKLRVTRESTLRSDLALQKALLTQEIFADRTPGESLGLCEMHKYERQRRRPTFKGVATAVLALKRMERLSGEWRAANALKDKLRSDAYRQTRGRPFPQ